MTETSAPLLPFGAALALSQRALGVKLHEALAESDTRPGTWYALNALTLRGPAVSREALRADLAQAGDVGPDGAVEVLDALLADGMACELAPDAADDDRIELTPAGKALFGRLGERVQQLAAEELSAYDPADITTIQRVLTDIARRGGLV